MTCYRYTAPAITGRYTYTSFIGLSDTHDICKTDNGWIWIACESSSHPVRAYSGGACQYVIDSTVVPYARGITVDSDGYLWVSDPVNDLIYQVDPYGTGLETATWGGIKASF
jgi:hypothetical protein